MTQETLATLFYDGACPLCQREMKILARRKSPRLQLVDIHTSPNLAPEERETMLRRLHLRQADGRWLTGVDASVAAWRYSPMGWLLRPLRWPLVGPVVDTVYAWWAERRFRKLYGSGEALCSLPEQEVNHDR